MLNNGAKQYAIVPADNGAATCLMGCAVLGHHSDTSATSDSAACQALMLEIDAK
jgi:hypothetical protein